MWYRAFSHQDAKNLVTRMLVVQPKKRITIPEIMAHPWLAEPSSTTGQGGGAPAVPLGEETRVRLERYDTGRRASNKMASLSRMFPAAPHAAAPQGPPVQKSSAAVVAAAAVPGGAVRGSGRLATAGGSVRAGSRSVSGPSGAGAGGGAGGEARAALAAPGAHALNDEQIDRLRATFAALGDAAGRLDFNLWSTLLHTLGVALPQVCACARVCVHACALARFRPAGGRALG
jgi:hypothetical protein